MFLFALEIESLRNIEKENRGHIKLIYISRFTMVRHETKSIVK